MNLDDIKPHVDAFAAAPAYYFMEDEINAYITIRELDGMIDSTLDFIRDDELTTETDSEGRFHDLAALEHVRKLYLDHHAPESIREH